MDALERYWGKTVHNWLEYEKDQESCEWMTNVAEEMKGNKEVIGDAIIKNLAPAATSDKNVLVTLASTNMSLVKQLKTVMDINIKISS